MAACEQKRAGGTGWSGRTGCTSHQCRAYQFTFLGETIRATTVVKYLRCQVGSQGSTRAAAQMRVTKAIKAQARYSRGLWIEHQNQAVASAGSERSAVCSRSLRVATERRGNAGKMTKSSNTTHCKIPCSCVSRARARSPKEAWSTHSGVNAASSEVTVGKEIAARRNIRSHESDGV